jgi:hypothetical protein
MRVANVLKEDLVSLQILVLSDSYKSEICALRRPFGVGRAWTQVEERTYFATIMLCRSNHMRNVDGFDVGGRRQVLMAKI